MRGPNLSVVCLGVAAVLAWGWASPPSRAQREEIDFAKAKQIRQRQLRGERLTVSEAAYLEAAKAAFARKNQAVGLPPPRRSTGLVPLPDLGGDERYKGQEGGLYGDGRNEPPERHRAAALAAARSIQPLDAEGKPDPAGKIALISIGMSNTSQEFQAFVGQVARASRKAPAVVLVDGAQGGMVASIWAHPDPDTLRGRPSPWETLDQRLAAAGVTAQQVQVAWIKHAQSGPAARGEFPKHADELQRNIAVSIRRLHERFPNLRLGYLSSRIYAGYATTPLNPEPYAYESAFAVRAVIRDQIAGRNDLAYDAEAGPVRAPVLLWGPYLWADGVKGRQAGDLVWEREDFAPDGTHPSANGQRKVAERLQAFFETDPTAQPWFVKAAEAPSTPSERD